VRDSQTDSYGRLKLQDYCRCSAAVRLLLFCRPNVLVTRALLSAEAFA
jgi:hypothetical protein